MIVRFGGTCWTNILILSMPISALKRGIQSRAKQTSKCMVNAVQNHALESKTLYTSSKCYTQRQIQATRGAGIRTHTQANQVVSYYMQYIQNMPLASIEVNTQVHCKSNLGFLRKNFALSMLGFRASSRG